MKNKFWKNKRVLITGHTGFKGRWLSVVLESLGAKIHGVSLEQNNHKVYYSLINNIHNIQLNGNLKSIENCDWIKDSFEKFFFKK